MSDLINKGSSKTLELKTANNYINNRELSREDLDTIKLLVHDFKTNFSGFLSLVVYRQISRLSKMLDKMEEIENHFYDNLIIENLSTEDFERYQNTISYNITAILNQLTNIASNPNMKLFFDNNNGLFVEKITQKLFHTDNQLRPDLEINSDNILSKEGRLKVQKVLTELIT